MNYENRFVRPTGMDGYFNFITDRLDDQQRTPQSITPRAIDLFRHYITENPTPNYFERADTTKIIASRTGLQADLIVQATTLDRSHFLFSPLEEQVLATAGLLTDLRKTIELKGGVDDSDKTIFGLLGADNELAYVYAKLAAATTHIDSNSPCIPDELVQLDWDRLYGILTLYEKMAHLSTAVDNFPFPESKNHGIIPINDKQRGFSFQQQLKFIDRRTLTATMADGTIYDLEVVNFILAKDAMDEDYAAVSRPASSLFNPTPSAFELVDDPRFKYMRGSIAALTEAEVKPYINYGRTIIGYREKNGNLYPVIERYPYQEVEDAVVDGPVQPEYVVYDSDGREHLIVDFFSS